MSDTASTAGKIQEYLDDNKLQPTLQVIINDLCKQLPSDAFGYLVCYFVSRRGFDCFSGEPTAA